MRIPDLRAKSDQIELDQISILLEYIQNNFVEVFGFDGDMNVWDSVRIKEEMEEIFDDPTHFTELMQTDFGKGVIVGAWLNEFVLQQEINSDFNEGEE